jgi:class 3 adenylate cyclase
MKSGRRFQTKLILAMIFVILVVTVALMTATSAKIRNAYTRQFSEEFENLVGRLDDSRKERSEEFLESAKEMALLPAVVKTIKGKPSQAELASFWEIYLEDLAPNRVDSAEPPKGPRGEAKSGEKRTGGLKFSMSPEISKKIGFVAVVNQNHSITPLIHPKQGANRGRLSQRMKGRADEAKAKLESVPNNLKISTFYLAIETLEGSEQVIEMVSTPVTDPTTGKLIGRFLRSSSVETDAERSLDRFQREFASDERLKSGIYLDGAVFGKNLSKLQADAMGAIVSAELKEARDRNQTLKFETKMSGKPYLFYVSSLNDETSIQEAFQVAAFPMTNLVADLALLRLTGTGIGLFALILGASLAYLLGRKFAAPIIELSRGTRAVQEGNLDINLNVKSKDELGELTDSFNQMVELLRQKAIYRELLGKVSDETVAQAMISGTLDLELGGEIKDVSILFCDIRGFTQHTENMHPGDVIELLNQHMTAMTKVVRNYYGVVDKFVGDEIMAVFGALKSHGNDAHSAAACAREMIAERNRLNEGLEVPIEIGIGVASGEVVAGCMGSSDRLNYTVLGAKVNLAARLCSAAERGEVVIDKATADQISPHPEIKLLEGLKLKGIQNAVEAFTLTHVSEPEMKNEPIATRVAAAASAEDSNVRTS